MASACAYAWTRTSCKCVRAGRVRVQRAAHMTIISLNVLAQRCKELRSPPSGDGRQLFVRRWCDGGCYWGGSSSGGGGFGAGNLWPSHDTRRIQLLQLVYALCASIPSRIDRRVRCVVTCAWRRLYACQSGDESGHTYESITRQDIVRNNVI